jgi:hypothetical protein
MLAKFGASLDVKYLSRAPNKGAAATVCPTDQYLLTLELA